MNRQLKLAGKVALMVVVAGLIVSPLDASIQRDRREMRYGGHRITLELRQLMGQGLAIALLGGFRAVVADWLWIKMHVEWEEGNLYRIPPYLQAVVWLQPQSEIFRDMGAWHIGYNLYAYEINRRDIPPEIRILNARKWRDLAAEFLEDGINDMPDSATLYVSLARLYDDPGKFNAPCLSIEYWKSALDKKGCPVYAHRMVGHAIHRCAEQGCDPAKFREALDWWLTLWLRPHDDPTEMWSTVRRQVRILKTMCEEFGVLSQEEIQRLSQKEIESGIPLQEMIFGSQIAPMTLPQLRNEFAMWSIEWLRPHNDCQKLWSIIRQKILELKPQISLTPEEEAHLWEEENLPMFKIPDAEKIFKNTKSS